MQLTMLPGYPDLMGRRAAFTAYGSPATTYTASAGPPLTGGDTITLPGYENYIDCILEVPFDTTGRVYGVAQPSSIGPRATWNVFYYTAAGVLVPSYAGNLIFNGVPLIFVVSGFMVGT
jgi:hypothetical protein